MTPAPDSNPRNKLLHRDHPVEFLAVGADDIGRAHDGIGRGHGAVQIGPGGGQIRGGLQLISQPRHCAPGECNRAVGWRGGQESRRLFNREKRAEACHRAGSVADYDRVSRGIARGEVVESQDARGRAGDVSAIGQIRAVCLPLIRQSRSAEDRDVKGRAPAREIGRYRVRFGMNS